MIAVLLTPGYVTLAAGAPAPAPAPDGNVDAGVATPTSVLSAPAIPSPDSPTPMAERYLAALVASGAAVGEPLPLPEPAAERPLAKALKHLAQTRGSDDDRALEAALLRADTLPMDLQRALAVIVLATADAGDATRAAPGDQAEATRAALLMTQAVDDARPVLQRYALLYEAGAPQHTVAQARAMDRIIAVVTGDDATTVEEAPPLPDAILELYGVLHIDVVPGDAETLRAGTEALPPEARRAMAHVVAARADAARLRVEAFSGLTDEDLALLFDPSAAERLSTTPTPEADAELAEYLAVVAKVDHEKLAAADLTVAMASARAHAILSQGGESSAPDPAPLGPLQNVWNAVKRFFTAIVPVGTASAQSGWAGQECPTWSPLHDCDNDVWFMDPFGIVVVSGYGSTRYDDRYGKLTLREHGEWTFNRLLGDVSVDGRDYNGNINRQVEGRAVADRWNNAARDVPDEAATAAERPFYAASLDLGGGDVYINHTGSTASLNALFRESQNVTTSDVHPFLANLPGSNIAIEYPGMTYLARNLPLQVSVLVDVGGNDKYGSDRPSPQRPNGIVATASVGGLGFILDADGDDVYKGGDVSVAVASLLSSAYLLDLNGDDQYDARNQSMSAAVAMATALLLDDCKQTPVEPCREGADTYRSGQFSQGSTAFLGTAALVDRGGDDAYSVVWDPENGFFGSTDANSQGIAAFMSFAAFADLGGTNDTGIRPDEKGQSIGFSSRTNATLQPNSGEAAAYLWANPSIGAAGLALDVDYTPDLRTFTTPRSTALAEWGEMTLAGFDLPQLFAVDALTNTDYRSDYVVLVDILGRDTYVNNAGANLQSGDTALLVDLSGDDIYNGRTLSEDKDRWGVQGAASGGVGMLLDMGQSDDHYMAKDVAQGVAEASGVGLLVDAGYNLRGDRFTAGNLSQGAAIQGGVGLLIATSGNTRYSAETLSQGFGAENGVGLLVDAGSSDGPGDAYELKGSLGQGAAVDAGTGLLIDLGGNDTYTAGDHAQGYATLNFTNGGIAIRSNGEHSTPVSSSLGALVDMKGRDRYEGTGTHVHGYADNTTGRLPVRFTGGAPVVQMPPQEMRSMAFLLDFAQPSGAASGPVTEFSNHYSRWLRSGAGDEYIPTRTPWGQLKSENAYWDQPQGASAVDDRPLYRVGRGMDNPPVAGYLSGVNQTLGALTLIHNITGVNAAALVVGFVSPEVVVDATTADCDTVEEHTEPLAGEVCLVAEVYGSQPLFGLTAPEAGGATGDAEVDFFVTGPNGTKEYVASATPILSATGSGDTRGIGRITLVSIGSKAKTPARATHMINTSMLNPNSTIPDRMERVWPDGAYQVTAVARGLNHFLTAGRAVGSNTAPYAVENLPALLGVNLTHPNPDRDDGANFQLQTTHYNVTGYSIEIDAGGDTIILNNTTLDPAVDCRERPAVPMYCIDVKWNATVDGERLPQGSYPYTVAINNSVKFTEPMDGVLTSDRTPPTAHIGLPADAVGWPNATRNAQTGTYNVTIPIVGVDAGAGIRHFLVTLDKNHTPSLIASARPVGDAGVYRGEFTVRNVSDGQEIALTIQPVDRADNPGQPRSRTIVVDLDRPTATTVLVESAPAHQNSLRFPVSWNETSEDTVAVHAFYRVPDPMDPFAPFTEFAVAREGDPAYEARNLTFDAVAVGEATRITSGVRVEFEVRAEDRAGNIQTHSPARVRYLTLDLDAPVMETPMVYERFTSAEASWSLSEPGNVHRFTLIAPNGTERTVWKNVSSNGALFELGGLEPATRYAYEAASRDEGGNWVTSGRQTFTTATSLVADIVSPAADAPLRGRVPVHWVAGAAGKEVGGDRSVTWSLNATVQTANGTKTHVLVPETEMVIRGDVDDPSEPQADWYPTIFDTERFPDAPAVTLTLKLTNNLESYTVTRRVVVDNTPPVTPSTGAALEGDAGDRVDGVQWYRSPVTVAGLNPEDETSGVAATYYGFSAGNVTHRYHPNAPPTIDGEGVHTLYFRSIDAAGNEEERLNRVSFGVDTRPPQVEVLVDGGRQVTKDPKVRVMVLPDDGPDGSNAVALRVGEGSTGLEAAPWMAYDPAQFDHALTLTDSDGAKRVFAQVRDAAGNVGRGGTVVFLEAHAPQLETPLTVERTGYTDAVLTWKTNKESITRLEYGLNGSLTRIATVQGHDVVHRVILQDLTPGATYTARAVLEDRAGNREVTSNTTLITQPDDEPPTTPSVVTVTDLENGQIAIEWPPAGDDVGVDKYRVLRAQGEDALTQIAEVEDTRYRDASVTPGDTYRYALQAVDLAGNTGPRSPVATGVATTHPELLDGEVDPRVGTASTRFTFSVTYRDADGDLPAHVRVLVDGDAVELAPVATGSVRDGVRYSAARTLAETSLAAGAHTYRFTANDGDHTVEWPAIGAQKGPVVLVPQDGDGDDDSFLTNIRPGSDQVPTLNGGALMLLMGALALALRRPPRRGAREEVGT